MFLTGLSGYLKTSVRIQGWRDNKARSLGEAALLAHTLVDAEDLPIGKIPTQEGHTADIDGWYAESILNTIPVYGTRAGNSAPERIGARTGLRLMDGAQYLGPDAEAQPVWSNLHVKREDFARYIDWLRSVW
jgi:hypothetical protein